MTMFEVIEVGQILQVVDHAFALKTKLKGGIIIKKKE